MQSVPMIGKLERARQKNGKLKIISFYAKKTRGSMARFIIENRITRANDLLGFNLDGYEYSRGLSSELEPVFTRPERA